MSNLKIEGMSDAELESLCKPEKGKLSFPFSWTPEIYSFGKCIRNITGYPKFLPLFIYSDHGAGLHSNFYPHELNNKSNIHLTWHPEKANRYSNIEDRRVVRIAHPWVQYKKKIDLKRSDRCSGTLVFYTHHVPGIKWEGHATQEYFDYLRNLPEEFQPIILCLHMHDINAGNHKSLRNAGFPIVTAGNTLSSQFVDRFYDLISSFSYGTSQEWGSQVAYCVEFGMPFFFCGAKPRLININHKEMPLGEVAPYQDEIHEDYAKRAMELFGQPVKCVTKEQQEFVNKILGLDSEIDRSQLARILWIELFRHWKDWILIPKYLVAYLLGKIGILESIKKLVRFNTH